MYPHTLRDGAIGAWRRPIAAALLLAIITGCGGGGGSSPTAMTPVDTGGGNGTNMPDPGTGNGSVMEMPGAGNGGGMPPASVTSSAGTGTILNVEAADLADHWHIHAGTSGLVDSLGLSTAPDHAVAQEHYTKIAKPAEIDTPPTMDVQGQRGGITVGRFTGGPADHLQITLDYHCSPGCYAAFPEGARPVMARTAKRWSHRLLATLPPYQINRSDPNAVELNRGPLAPGTDSFTTRGVHIFVEKLDPSSSVAGTAQLYAAQVTEDHFWGRTGAIRINEDLLATLASGYPARTAGTAAHEIGHILTDPIPTVYYGLPEAAGDPAGFVDRVIRGPHRRFIDTTTGTWTGPAVARTPGGERPAPFAFRIAQDGESVIYDYTHWRREAGPSAVSESHIRWEPGPHPLDTAYLADLGYDVAPDAVADAPELYGYGAWADDSGISVAVTRELTSYLDDTLSAGATAFGRAPATAFSDAHAGMTGTASWTGVLLGIDLQTEGLPPVTGDTTLSVALADLTGTARFSGLEVLADGSRADFRQNSLAYDFTVDGNTFGNGRAPAQGQIEGSWYGDRHDEVAGTVHDTRADTGLLGAFIGER